MVDFTEKLASCVQFLQEHRVLMESQITACYVKNYIQREVVREEWLQELERFTYPELVRLRRNIGGIRNSGLRRFLEKLDELSPEIHTKWTQEIEPASLEIRQMTPKKIHEVKRMAALVSHIALETEVTKAVDLGSGLGYLSHFLASKCELSVLAVEAKEHNTHAARERGEYISRKMHKNADFETVAMHVTNSNFTSLCPVPCVLLGLHTCGDLAPISLRMFTTVPTVKAIINVGCCYNLLTERFPSSDTPAFSQYLSEIGLNEHNSTLDHTFTSSPDAGFPMSDYLKNAFPEFYLGRMARTLALNDFSENLLANPEENLRKSSFRAAFQCLLADFFPHLSNTYAVGRTKKSVTFSQFTRLASRNMGINFPLSDSELDAIYAEKYSKIEKKAGCLWILRGLLAPIIEHLIICDRAVYLQEQGLKVTILQLFDREISPRNMAIVGIKT